MPAGRCAGLVRGGARPRARRRAPSVRSNRTHARSHRLPASAGHHRPAARVAPSGGSRPSAHRSRSGPTGPCRSPMRWSTRSRPTSQSTAPDVRARPPRAGRTSSGSARPGASSAPTRGYRPPGSTTLGTRSPRCSCPVAAAAEYLGHSPAELLGTYAHLVPQDHDRHARRCKRPSSGTPRVTAVSQRWGTDPR